MEAKKKRKCFKQTKYFLILFNTFFYRSERKEKLEEIFWPIFINSFLWTLKKEGFILHALNVFKTSDHACCMVI